MKPPSTSEDQGPGTADLLAWLLREARNPVAPAHASYEDWWQAFQARRREWAKPVDQAIAGGMLADRVGYAFAAGYQSALRRMDPGLPDDRVASFSVTEEGGGHPRAVQSVFEPAPDGGFSLSGKKKWATMASSGGLVLVAASTGTDAEGRNRLRVARVDLGAPGVTVIPMPKTDFVPEVRHCRLEFDRVRIALDQLLPGDGYLEYVKPFRTIEDVHVTGALLAYLLNLMFRYDWPRPLREELLHLIVSARALGGSDATSPATHIALEGLLHGRNSLLERASACWEKVDAEVRRRWERDSPLTGIAGQARALRVERAWEKVAGGGVGAPG